MPKNQRNSRLSSNSSQTARSLLTENNPVSSDAFSRRSGGMDGRPTSAYIRSNSGESRSNASSAKALMARSG